MMIKKLPSLIELQHFYQSGNLNKAKQGYLNWLKTQPDNVDILNLLALISAEEGDLTQAQAYLEKAITYNPDDSRLRLHLANIFKGQGLLNKAENILLNLTNQHPEYAQGYNNLGTVYFAQKNFPSAILSFEKAIQLQANYTDAYYNLGLSLRKMQQLTASINAFEAVLKFSTDHVGALFNLASLCMQTEAYPKAIVYLQKILEQHPFHFESITNLATSYLKMGDLYRAKDFYLQAHQLMASDTQVLFNLGVINMQLGFLKEAAHFYLETVKIQSDLYDAQYNLGYAYLLMKEYPAALQHFHEAKRINPQDEPLQHLINILSENKTITTSPPAYISALFDSYADHYDAHLVTGLQYQVPQQIYNVLKQEKLLKSDLRILDLGCGTGLSGSLFRLHASQLVGIDISKQMLAIAAQKNIYDELLLGDISTLLKEMTSAYNFVLAADVLVYYGALEELFALVYSHLVEGGYFVFNVEVGKQFDFELTSSGRFLHHLNYIEKVAISSGFSLAISREITMRKQDQRMVHGQLFLLHKKHRS